MSFFSLQRNASTRLVLAVATVVVALVPRVTKADAAPWRLGEAAGLPSWFEVGFNTQLRFEHLENDFREPRDISATAMVIRTLATVKARISSLAFAIELADARAWTDDETTVTARDVNTLAILQGYVEASTNALFLPRDRLEGRLGRITMDIGSRRLVARNIYRNTINGFTGLDLAYACGCGHELRFAAAMPVVRLPKDVSQLRDNDYGRDEENTDAMLVAFLYRSPAIAGLFRLELFNVSLFERDGDFETKNRELWTPGLRLKANPVPGRIDAELEAMAQLGTSRATSAASDTTELDHRAYSVHAELGYTIDASWSPRLLMQFDHSTGDDDPDDDSNERFDPLYGVPRFDLSVTGIFRPVTRSNLTSAGARLLFRPDARFDGFLSHRVFWLASATDAWTTTGFRDPAGDSGRLLGQQFEARLRWKVLPGNLDFEVGGARLRLAGFANKVAAKLNDPIIYFYTQLTGTI